MYPVKGNPHPCGYIASVFRELSLYLSWSDMSPMYVHCMQIHETKRPGQSVAPISASNLLFFFVCQSQFYSCVSKSLSDRDLPGKRSTKRQRLGWRLSLLLYFDDMCIPVTVYVKTPEKGAVCPCVWVSQMGRPYSGIPINLRMPIEINLMRFLSSDKTLSFHIQIRQTIST